MIDLRITLAPDGGLRLILPTGRSLDVGEGAPAMYFIKRILVDATRGKSAHGSKKPGYIGEFPTQHIIDIWRKQDAIAKEEREREAAEAVKAELAAKGIDLETLDFQL